MRYLIIFFTLALPAMDYRQNELSTFEEFLVAFPIISTSAIVAGAPALTWYQGLEEEEISFFDFFCKNKVNNFICMAQLFFITAVLYLQKKAQNQRNANSRLLVAAKERNVPEVMAALNRGADPNYTKSDGKRALYYSLRSNDLKLANTLKKHGADLNYIDEETQDSLLLQLASSCDPSKCRHGVEWLLKNKANPHHKNKRGLNVLYHACRKENLGLLQLLYAHGVTNFNDLVTCPIASRKPLHVCAHNAFYEGVVFCVEHGAQVDAQDAAGNTALHEAAQLLAPDVLCYLMYSGAKRDILNNAGKLPQDLAPPGSIYLNILQEKKFSKEPAVTASKIEYYKETMRKDFTKGENIHRVLRQREIGQSKR